MKHRDRILKFSTVVQRPIATTKPATPWTAASAAINRAASPNQVGALVAVVLTLLALLIHGYHPYAEDAGLYLADVEKLLHPQLFPLDPGFVTADLHLSLFAQLCALLVRVLHLDLMMVMLVLYVASLWTTLFGVWRISVRCYQGIEASLGATLLLALWITLPVAGTSLMLMDPYVSARSISTPCSLLALASALDIAKSITERAIVSWKAVALCSFSLFLAGMIHPLMAGYALGCVLLVIAMFVSVGHAKTIVVLAFCSAAVLLAATLEHFVPRQGADYATVALTRTYWFLSNWHWYELLGLAGPLLLLAAIAYFIRHGISNPALALYQMAITAGLTGFVVSALFAHKDSTSYMVARLQPLRIFQPVYVIMILALGALLGQKVLKRNVYAWTATVLLMGGLMCYVQMDTFPASNHIELPWSSNENQWVQGFLWIRQHTPEDATFALDAHYIDAKGEDAQNFRAIAQRSALPDYAKDGGIASIAPDLTAEWIQGQRAQDGLERRTDAERLSQLQSTRVQWMVLSATASTRYACPYQNTAMKVCRLPER